MKVLSTVFLCSIGMAALGQKLPAVQQAAVRVPANVKIDGKATEWGEKFEAYNPATDIFYTIANDDKKLYLVLKTTDRYNITRIVNGGIKLSIQKNGLKSDVRSASIQFPYMEKGKRVSFIQRLDLAGATGARKAFLLDSAMKVNNQKLRLNVKQLYTKGMPGVDSIISIYNDHGIEVANIIDVEKVYTAEIAIDLKLLSLSVTDKSKFAYHIAVNGGVNRYATGLSFGMVMNDDGTPAEAFAKRLNDFNDVQSTTTDFWGEYTLIR